jgi:hypothetical protein
MNARRYNGWQEVVLPPDVAPILERCRRVLVPESREELLELALGGQPDRFEVAYEVPGQGRLVEAEVVRCRNGVAANYPDVYMRRRDPDCLVVADEQPSDKPRYRDRFDVPFEDARRQVLEWLAAQELIVLPFLAGNRDSGFPALLVAPLNAAFFAGGLADLQGMLPASTLAPGFTPRSIMYVAPPFRHILCGGRQMVIHNRRPDMHEIFALNLYPGPSAKKGVYGILLNVGREEGWVTAHGSTVQVVTPYDNIVTIMHEGASGGGKSEMLEYAHRQRDGRLLLGENLVTGERRLISLPRGCDLQPVTDDMASCHADIQNDSGRLVVSDAEEGWFVRVDHIRHYGTDPQLESICTQPTEPLIFLNIEGVPQATCLIWEHIQDAPGKPCPNPRVILPRRLVPNIVDEPVEVDIRSFGVRTPPCTAEKPTYGIFGLLHVLPPALAWLWRMVAPRGHANPSVTASTGLASEGVGSYWPFATGRRVDQANLLLQQILDTPRTRYTLSPNQHIGAWKVGFMPQWIAREYLARRGGARFRRDQLAPARCPLLGYTLESMLVEGTPISHWMLHVEAQPEVGVEAYDAGSKELQEFFARELRPYLDEADLHPVARQIVTCCLDGGSTLDYEALIQTK